MSFSGCCSVHCQLTYARCQVVERMLQFLSANPFVAEAATATQALAAEILTSMVQYKLFRYELHWLHNAVRGSCVMLCGLQCVVCVAGVPVVHCHLAPQSRRCRRTAPAVRTSLPPYCHGVYFRVRNAPRTCTQACVLTVLQRVHAEGAAKTVGAERCYRCPGVGNRAQPA